MERKQPLKNTGAMNKKQKRDVIMLKNDFVKLKI
jgi:hypothetical protein